MSSNKNCGHMSLLYSVADKPLELWSKHISLGGKIRRVNDDTLHGDKVIEILGSPHYNVVPTYIITPATIVDTLNIRLAILVLVIKNLKSCFKLEVQITDKKQYRRRFSFLTYNLEKLPSVNANVARIPLKLEECWNTLEINLQAFCRMTYGTDYEALQRMIVYSNCRLRRVYLQDRHYDHNEISIELCNMFFNTYMSKWKVNFIEKTCQTEDYHTGLSKKRDSNYLATNGRAISPTKTGLSTDTNDINKSKNLNTPGTIANLCNSKPLKKNYVSSGTSHNETNMYNNQNIMKQQSRNFAKSLVNESIIVNEVKEIGDNITEKQKNRNKETTHETRNANSFIKFNYMLHPASSTKKNQFLKMHVDKTLFRKNVQNKPEFPRRLYPYRIRDLDNIPVTQRSNINSVMNTQFKKFVANVSSKSNLPGNIGSNRDQIKNGIIVSNKRHAKKNEKTINDLRSLPTIEKNIEDNCTLHTHLTEKEMKPTYLKNYKIVYNRISEHSPKRRFFEKLLSKGFIRLQNKSPCDK